MKDPVVLRVPSCRWAVLPMVSFCRCALASCVNGQFYRWQVMLDDNFTGASDCAVGKITVFLFILKKVNFQTKKLLTTKIYYSFPSYKFGMFFFAKYEQKLGLFSHCAVVKFANIWFCRHLILYLTIIQVSWKAGLYHTLFTALDQYHSRIWTFKCAHFFTKHPVSRILINISCLYYNGSIWRNILCQLITHFSFFSWWAYSHRWARFFFKWGRRVDLNFQN